MTPALTRRWRSVPRDGGAAIVLALLATALLGALGLGVASLSTTEMAAAANFRVDTETRYAADAAIEFSTAEVRGVSDWSAILSGAVRSVLVGPTLTPILPSGGAIDLGAMTAEIQAASDAAFGLGANNPRWVLFADGLLSDLAPAAFLAARPYVAVWVADDPAETDGNPVVESNGLLMLMARAMGPGGSMRAIEAMLGRPATGTGAADVRIVSWREVT